MTHDTKPFPPLAEAIASMPVDQRVHYYTGAAKETARQNMRRAERILERLDDGHPNEYDIEFIADLAYEIFATARPIADQDTRWHQIEDAS